jgi:hypothetical protein
MVYYYVFMPIDPCLTKLYVMAFTSSSTNDYHNIELHYNGSVQTMTLYDLPGIIEFQSNKGDLWEFSLPSCITLDAITRVSVVANGDDAWNIGSIVTLVRDIDDNIQLLTQDFGVGRWVDTNGELEHRNFKLTSSDGVSSGMLLCDLVQEKGPFIINIHFLVLLKVMAKM